MLISLSSLVFSLSDSSRCTITPKLKFYILLEYFLTHLHYNSLKYVSRMSYEVSRWIDYSCFTCSVTLIKGLLYQQGQDYLYGQEAFKDYRNNCTNTLLTSIAHCELGEGIELREKSMKRSCRNLMIKYWSTF